MSRGPHARSNAANPAESTNHLLNAYSLAAVTAGVGMLALAQPAEGSVVITKTNIQINFGSQVSIDLNNDGVNDFTLAAEGANYDHSFYGTFAAIPLNGGKVVGGNRGALGPYASALAKGANIGPSAHFSTSVARQQITVERFNGLASASTIITYYGKWTPGSGNHYLGVKFLIKGAAHYGWIRLSLSKNSEQSGTVTEYAYETVAGKKIGAGNTTDSSVAAAQTPAQQRVSSLKGPSLGMMALGADGLALWHREENASAPPQRDLKD
jgi:hypothetical protein